MFCTCHERIKKNRFDNNTRVYFISCKEIANDQEKFNFSGYHIFIAERKIEREGREGVCVTKDKTIMCFLSPCKQ